MARQAKDYSLFNEAINAFEKATNDFLACGVHVDAPQNFSELMSSSFVNTFIAAFAKQIDRNYVRAHISAMDAVTLSIPYLKKLKHLYAPLLLVATKTHQPRYVTNSQIEYWVTSGTITFHFPNRNVFNGWLNRCKTDPLFRSVLKL